MWEGLLSRLERLRHHTDPPSTQLRHTPTIYTEFRELAARSFLVKWGLPCPTAPASVSAAIKSQIVGARYPKTARSRVTEIEISNLIARSDLTRFVMRLLFAKMVAFFEAVGALRPGWLPSASRLDDLRCMRDHGNHRQQFHAIRDALPALRELLRRLAESHTRQSDTALQQLGDMGILDPARAVFLVQTAFKGLVDEILSPPAELRRVWKPVARERIAPEDGGEPGPFTSALWSLGLRVRDVAWPPMSQAEIRQAFGDESASASSHGTERVPLACGAHKYRLVERDPVVVANTSRGLFMTSGPSGTAYRFLNLWLLFGGSRGDLASVRFAFASLLLSGRHHSLIEVLTVCAPLMGDDAPGTLEEMIDQLVPHDLGISDGEETCSFSRMQFHVELSQSIDRLLGVTTSDPRSTTTPFETRQSQTLVDFRLAAVRRKFLGMREVTGLQEDEPSSLEDAVSFCWPSSSPPRPANLELAEALCREFTSGELGRSLVASPFGQAGWSAQDCIKVDAGPQRLIVKMPREWTDAAARAECLSEAARTSWAASAGLGPRVLAIDRESGAFALEFITGRTLTKAAARERTADVLGLLRRFHDADAAPPTWMKEYDPAAVVRRYLEQARLRDSISPCDVRLVEAVLSGVAAAVADAPPGRLVPCHNDFHCQNIMLDDNDAGRLRAIDYENCDLADPMWDLAYLTVNLELEQPLALADAYGCTDDQRARLPALYSLALAHCAVWCANHGPLWVGHHRLLMSRLEHVRCRIM